MRFFNILFLLFFLSGCSFSPLYLENSDHNVTAQTALIQIEPINGVLGYPLKNQLNTKLQIDDNETPRYRLAIQLSEQVVGDLGIQKTNISTRSRLILTAKYTLKDIKTNKTLVNSKTKASGSYNLTTGYSTLVAKDQMAQNLAKIVADNISIHILMYFKKQEVSRESTSVSN